ncbi:flagellar type III secretion system pore protein FliP [Clostridium sp. Marseille-Q7071]
MKSKYSKYLKVILFAAIIIFFSYKVAYATAGNRIPIPDVSINFNNGDTNPKEFVDNIKLILLLTVLTLLPSIIIMTTGFVRIVTVLSLLKNALGVQQSIPRQITIGLSLFLTFFVMAPTFGKINNEAITPYIDNKISTEVAYDKAVQPLKDFMLKQTRAKDLKLFLEVGKLEDTVKTIKDENNVEVPSYDEVPLYAVVPAFIISELRTAFEIGFLLFIPFLIVDIVASSVLMAMGMFMLPPAMISLPFKLLLFVLVDGWNLISQSLIMSFK